MYYLLLNYVLEIDTVLLTLSLDQHDGILNIDCETCTV